MEIVLVLFLLSSVYSQTVLPKIILHENLTPTVQDQFVKYTFDGNCYIDDYGTSYTKYSVVNGDTQIEWRDGCSDPQCTLSCTSFSYNIGQTYVGPDQRFSVVADFPTITQAGYKAVIFFPNNVPDCNYKSEVDQITVETIAPTNDPHCSVNPGVCGFEATAPMRTLIAFCNGQLITFPGITLGRNDTVSPLWQWLADNGHVFNSIWILLLSFGIMLIMIIIGFVILGVIVGFCFLSKKKEKGDDGDVKTEKMDDQT